ncbi:hypothetical protein RJ035_003772 [Blastomyces gilchristii]
MKDIVTIYDSIDIVVNNAGYVQTGILEEVTPEATFRQFQVNTFGPLNGYCAVLPYLCERNPAPWLLSARWRPRILCCLLWHPPLSQLMNPNAKITSTGSTEWIPDYTEINAPADSSFAKFHAAELGNPVGGVEVIYDVVTSSGHAAGRDLLALGSDAMAEISKPASQTLADLKAWQEIIIPIFLVSSGILRQRPVDSIYRTNEGFRCSVYILRIQDVLYVIFKCQWEPSCVELNMQAMQRPSSYNAPSITLWTCLDTSRYLVS